MLGICAFIAAIIGGFNQVRGAIAGGLLLGVIDNFAAAYLSAQYRAAIPLLHADRGDSVPSAGPARPRRGAHRMSRRVSCSAASPVSSSSPALIAAPFGLKPYGIYILSLWAVTTIAAIGLNLTLGYAGQISLAQAAFVGIGAYVGGAADHQTAIRSAPPICSPACRASAIGWLLGYPALRVQHHYLAFVTLAFTTLVYLIFRNEEWITGGIYGISNIPRPSAVRLCAAHAARILLLLPRAIWRWSRLPRGG